MAVAMMVDNPEGTQEIYDRVRERLGMENATGGIFHIAGPSPNGGWRVIEVWESEEDAKRFVKVRMLPAFEALGALPPPPPDFWPVHNYMAQPRPHTDLEDSRVAVRDRLASEQLSREIAGRLQEQRDTAGVGLRGRVVNERGADADGAGTVSLSKRLERLTGEHVRVAIGHAGQPFGPWRRGVGVELAVK